MRAESSPPLRMTDGYLLERHCNHCSTSAETGQQMAGSVPFGSS
jgi:hypothetical protein